MIFQSSRVILFVSADDCIMLSDDYVDGLKIMSEEKSKRNDSDVLMGQVQYQ